MRVIPRYELWLDVYLVSHLRRSMRYAVILLSHVIVICFEVSCSYSAFVNNDWLLFAIQWLENRGLIQLDCALLISKHAWRHHSVRAVLIILYLFIRIFYGPSLFAILRRGISVQLCFNFVFAPCSFIRDFHSIFE